MFEIGKGYYITTLIHGDEVSSNWKVVSYDSPLLMLENDLGEELILNTQSSAFKCAKPRKDYGSNSIYATPKPPKGV